MVKNDVSKKVDIEIQPRGFNEQQAARYIGMSVSYLRKDRMNGTLQGRTPGPRWGKIGKRVVYLKEDLDLWLEKVLVCRK